MDKEKVLGVHVLWVYVGVIVAWMVVANLYVWWEAGESSLVWPW